MSEERKYKYKLDVDDDVIVIGRKFSDAGRQNQIVIRNGREGIWKPNLGMRKKIANLQKFQRLCMENLSHVYCKEK